MMKKWYALKIFYNRFSEIEATLSRDGDRELYPDENQKLSATGRGGRDQTGPACRHADVPALR